MAAPVPLRTDFDAAQLRGLAKRSRDPDQTRRLLALANGSVGRGDDVHEFVLGHGALGVLLGVRRFANRPLAGMKLLV